MILKIKNYNDSSSNKASNSVSDSGFSIRQLASLEQVKDAWAKLVWVHRIQSDKSADLLDVIWGADSSSSSKKKEKEK